MVEAGIFANFLYKNGIAYQFAIFSPLISLFEIFAATSLLFNIYPRKILKSLLIFVSVVSFVYLYIYFSSNVETCNCFGSHFDLFNTFAAIIIRNIILITAILFLIKNTKHNKKTEKTGLIFLFIILIFAAFINGYSYTPPQKNATINTAESAVYSKVFDSYNFSADSSYMVMLMTYTCPHCINSIANANMYKGKLVDQLIFIGTGNYKKLEKLKQNILFNGIIINISSKDMAALTNKFPVFLFIRNNKIVHIHSGELPSFITFRQHNTHY